MASGLCHGDERIDEKPQDARVREHGDRPLLDPQIAGQHRELSLYIGDDFRLLLVAGARTERVLGDDDERGFDSDTTPLLMDGGSAA